MTELLRLGSWCARGALLAWLVSGSLVATEPGNLLQQSRAAWRTWAPRAQLAPVAKARQTPRGLELSLDAHKFEQYGEWYTTIDQVQGGRYYEIDVAYRTRSIADENLSVAAIATWCGADCSDGALQRDYLPTAPESDAVVRCRRAIRAPAGVKSAKVELILRWASVGSVTFSPASFRETTKPASRLVRIAAAHLTPPIPSTVEKNLELVASAVDRAAAQRADLVCLPENVMSRGVALPVEQRAVAVVERTKKLLAAKAAHHHMYIAITLEEPAGQAVFNTGLLFDRQGKLVLHYRKVHLPLSEAELGYTPGSSYPVVNTDFGRVGILICWDYWFPEAARILRLKGADVVLLPLAGDAGVHWDAVTRTRAMENGVYLAASGLVPLSASRIVDPEGKVLSEVSGDDALAIAQIDLNREFRSPWLSVGPGTGEGKSLYLKERRADTYGPLVR